MDNAAAPSHRLCALLRPVLRPVPCIAGEIAALLTRAVLAQTFITTGWGKLTHIDKPTAFFADLGIPMPGVNAWIVAVVEFVGGILIAAGLGTRVAAFLQACTMVVALMTAHRAQVWPAITQADGDLMSVAPIPLLVFHLWLIKNGAGMLSLDRLIAVIRGKRRADAPMPVPR